MTKEKIYKSLTGRGYIVTPLYWGGVRVSLPMGRGWVFNSFKEAYESIKFKEDYGLIIRY